MLTQNRANCPTSPLLSCPHCPLGRLSREHDFFLGDTWECYSCARQYELDDKGGLVALRRSPTPVEMMQRRSQAWEREQSPNRCSIDKIYSR